MTTGHMIVLLYFVVFAIINFVIFMKLAKYWYMTAGVTKEDVARYMSEHISRRRYNYLIRWMRKRARDAKKFNMMLFFVLAEAFLALPVPAVAFTLAWSGNMAAVRAFMVIEALGTAIIAALGFSYGKKIEAESETYYASSQYKPYEGEELPEEIDDLDELYEEPEEKPVIYGLDYEETERREFKKFISAYIPKVLFAFILLFCLFSPIILNGFNFKTFTFDSPDSSDTSADTSQTQYTEDENAVPSQEVTITSIRELLIKDGYDPHGSLEEVSEKYPNFIFEDCLEADDLELHFEYFKLVNDEQAENFSERLWQDVLREYSTGSASETEEKGSGFYTKALETDSYYAACVLDGDGVLYVRCDNVSTTWMKVFLYDLGYLKEF